MAEEMDVLWPSKPTPERGLGPGPDRWATLGTQDSQLYPVQHSSRGSRETEKASESWSGTPWQGHHQPPKALRGPETLLTQRELPAPETTTAPDRIMKWGSLRHWTWVAKGCEG